MKSMGDVVKAAIAAAKAPTDEVEVAAPGASRGLKELRDTFKAGYIHATAEHGEES